MSVAEAAPDRGAEALRVARELGAGRVGRGHADRVGDDGREPDPLLSGEAVAGGRDDRDIQGIELADESGDLLADPAVLGEPVLGVVIAIGHREVDGRDVVLSVVVDHPLERLGDVVEVALAGAAEDLQRGDIGPGRNPGMTRVARGDQAGDGGAVLRVGRHRVACCSG